MNNYTNLTADNTYSREFWNAMRGNKGAEVKLDAGRDSTTGTYSLPDAAQAGFTKELDKQSVFRSLATVIKAYRGDYRILEKKLKKKYTCNDIIESLRDIDRKSVV